VPAPPVVSSIPSGRLSVVASRDVLSARAIRAVSAPALASHPRGAAMGAAPARCGSRHQSSSHLSRISLTSVLTSTRTVPRSADSAAGARPATHTSRAQAGSRPSRGAHGARAPATAPGPSRRPREKHKQRGHGGASHGNLGFNRVCGRIPDCRFGISICGRRFRTMFRWCMVGFPEPIVRAAAEADRSERPAQSSA
jgi:hypothetical protein